jgi:hypothetical protein
MPPAFWPLGWPLRRRRRRTRRVRQRALVSLPRRGKSDSPRPPRVHRRRPPGGIVGARHRTVERAAAESGGATDALALECLAATERNCLHRAIARGVPHRALLHRPRPRRARSVDGEPHRARQLPRPRSTSGRLARRRFRGNATDRRTRRRLRCRRNGSASSSAATGCTAPMWHGCPRVQASLRGLRATLPLTCSSEPR